jgi:hypothetical protein
MYHELELDHIVETTTRLRDRIAERFPDSGLSKIATELVRIARETGPILTRMRRPHRFVQIAVAVMVVLLITIPLAIIVARGLPALEVGGLAGLLQTVDSAIQDAVFISAAVYFLLTLESRLDRRVSLGELQRLRNIVHIIDMHQLTKDPEHLISPEMMTPSSPKRRLTRFEMARYLDYCTELLSLSSKIAAVHVQSVNDPVVLNAVNDIENLAASLSNKIWQKIVIVDQERRDIPIRPRLAEMESPHG